MPLADDPGRPAGRVLLDRAGEEIARFDEHERDDRRVADLFELADGVAPERAVRVALEELGGWRISAHERFGRLLVVAGARPRRHGHVMSRDLVRDPAPPEWPEPPLPDRVRLTAVDRPAIDLAPACRAAYPPEHPDYHHSPTPDRPELELDEIISGQLMGPLLGCSGLAVGDDGTVLGAVLVNRTKGVPPMGGPWIAQLFRRPDARGVGSALLRRALALATCDGLPAIGLAVTHGNPAARLYAAHGFADVLESLTVEL